MAQVIAQLAQLKRTDVAKIQDGEGGGFSQKTMQDQHGTYEKILSVIDDLKQELDTTQVEMDEKTVHLKEKRDLKDSEATSLETEFLDFKREVSKYARRKM